MFSTDKSNSQSIVMVQQSLAATLPPVKLFSQQRYFELGPKKLELSYFSHSCAIFSHSYAVFVYFPPSKA